MEFAVKVNIEIIEKYLDNQYLTQNEIYQFRSNNQDVNIFTYPSENAQEVVYQLMNSTLPKLNHLEYQISEQFIKLFQIDQDWLNNIEVHFIIGFPEKVNQLFRYVNDEKLMIVIDLYNYCCQYDDLEIATEAIIGYIKYITLLSHFDLITSNYQTHHIIGFCYSIMNAALADYFAQTEYGINLLNDPFIEKWARYEYKLFKKLAKVHSNYQVLAQSCNEYIANVISINREMVLIGTLAKIFLDSKPDLLISNYISKGPEEFCQLIAKSHRIQRIADRYLVNIIFNIHIILIGLFLGLWGIYQPSVILNNLLYKVIVGGCAIALIIKYYIRQYRYESLKYKMFIRIILIAIALCCYYFIPLLK